MENPQQENQNPHQVNKKQRGRDRSISAKEKTDLLRNSHLEFRNRSVYLLTSLKKLFG